MFLDDCKFFNIFARSRNFYIILNGTAFPSTVRLIVAIDALGHILCSFAILLFQQLHLKAKSSFAFIIA